MLDLSFDIILTNNDTNGEKVSLCREKFDHSLIIGVKYWSDTLI